MKRTTKILLLFLIILSSISIGITLDMSLYFLVVSIISTMGFSSMLIPLMTDNTIEENNTIKSSNIYENSPHKEIRRQIYKKYLG